MVASEENQQVALSLRSWYLPFHGVDLLAAEVAGHQWSIVRGQAHPGTKSSGGLANCLEARNTLDFSVAGSHTHNSGLRDAEVKEVNVGAISRPVWVSC